MMQISVKIFGSYLIALNYVYLFVPPSNLNLDFLKISGRNALLCKGLFGLMQSYYYLQRDLAGIQNMTSLQARLIALKEVMAHAL